MGHKIGFYNRLLKTKNIEYFMPFKIIKIKQNSIERECATSCSTQKDVELEKAVGGSLASVVILSVSLFSC